MSNGKTIGELMEEMRIKAGAKEYAGHTFMDLARFDDITRHMIVFDVLNNDSPVVQGRPDAPLPFGPRLCAGTGTAGARQHKILNHAKVRQGRLSYDHTDRE